MVAEYTIFLYDSGKVHLRKRSIYGDSDLLGHYPQSYATYGTIVNTDGSLSYPSGDKFHVKSDGTIFGSFYVDCYITTGGYRDFYIYQ